MPTSRILRFRGDSATLVLDATDPVTGEAFPLTGLAGLIFTAKNSPEDADADAVFQKSLSAGISVSGSEATVEVTYLDTDALEGRVTTLYCDLQAQDASGNVSTVWEGTITFKADITRGVSPAIPIYTTQPVAAAFTILTGVTGLTGGGATNLDGQATKSGSNTLISTGTVVLLTYGRVAQWWQLVAGTDAESVGTGVVRPDDYDGSTNARVWVQL